MRGAQIVLLAAAVCMSLTACASAGPSGPRDSSAPSATSSAATPSAGDRPGLVFGGECASALTAAEVGSAVGATVALNPADNFADTWSVQQLGGISCSWSDAPRHDLLWVTIIPAAAAGAQVAKQDAAQPYCYGGDVAAGQSDACSFGVVVGSWWFAGVAYTAEGSHRHGADAIAALLTALDPRLAAADPRVPAPVPGTWSTSIDCSVVAQRADLARVLGHPALAGSAGEHGGAEIGPGVAGALAATGYRTCTWDDSVTPGSSAFTIEVIPGAAWVLHQGGIVDPTPVAVSGAAAALTAPVVGASVSYLYVSDGTNLMILEPNSAVDVMTLAPAVTPLLKALAG